MRVVHIITGLATGGAERMLQDRVARTRHQVEVVVLSVEGEIADRLRADGVPVHSLGMSSNQDLRAVFALARLLRTLSPDVVHVHLYRALIYGRIAARMAGIRAVLATEHSALEDSTEGRPATRGVRILYRTAERLGRVTVAVSSTTREIMIRRWGIDASRIVVVPNGIDTKRLRITAEMRSTARAALGLADDVRLVVGAGRLVEGKRFDVLIDAVARLDPSVHLLIAGEGAERGALLARANQAGMAERVHFVGVVEDIVDALAPGDAFASASTAETYGIAIVEAYTAGLPVAYAHCPAVADVTGGAPHPRLVEAGGSVEGMAAAITTALGRDCGPDLVDDTERGRVDIEAVNCRLDDIEDLVGSGRWSPGAASALGDGIAQAR